MHIMIKLARHACMYIDLSVATWRAIDAVLAKVLCVKKESIGKSRKWKEGK